jgi:uncharacterized UBP type Zn finger protein
MGGWRCCYPPCGLSVCPLPLAPSGAFFVFECRVAIINKVNERAHVPDPKCTHISEIRDVAPASETCEECAKTGADPVQLRKCLTCGNVGCCDSSIGQHARKHFKETGHPIMESYKLAAGRENWRWCYIDNSYLDSELAAA